MMRPNINSEASVVSAALLVAVLTAFLSSVAMPQEKIAANAGAARKAPAAQELLGHADIVWAVALAPVRDGPTGGLLVSGGGGRFVPQGDLTFLGVGWEAGMKDFAVRIWDPVTGEVRRKLEGHVAPVHAVAWSRDGRRIASASDDGSVRIWNAETGEPIREIKAHTARASSVAFCRPDGSRFISGGRDSTLREFDVATGREVRHFEGVHDSIWDVAVSPDDDTVAACGLDHGVDLWNLTTGKWIRRLEGHKEKVAAVAFSPDGTRILSGGWDNIACLHDARTGELLKTLTGHKNRIEGVAFSPDGRRGLTGSLDCTVRVWDLTTGAEVTQLIGPTAPVRYVAYAADGRSVAASSWDHVVRVWELPVECNPVMVWQVLPEAYTPNDEVKRTVAQRIEELGGAAEAERDAAERALVRLGATAVPLILAEVNNPDLDEEQSARLKKLAAVHPVLSSQERTALRNDVRFLIDCLESEDAQIRRVALQRLREVDGETIAASFDAGEPDAVRRNAAVERLRQFLPR